MGFLKDNAEETQDTASPKQSVLRHSYVEAFYLWLFLLFWEAMTSPAISHSDLHSPMEILTVAGLVYGAFYLGRYHADPPAAFFFGMGCAFVFLPRYVFSAPMYRQYRHYPPDVPLTIALWVGVALGLGFACWLVAMIATRVQSQKIKSRTHVDEIGDETPKHPQS